ncbi:MAG: hypothetical protein CHACPFDD_02548 [Phycisphaerae bacterium]|nr:hypothetical protein [Phycisphaerae bacterium]
MGRNRWSAGRWLAVGSLLGAAALGGCIARVQDGLGILLSPDAFDNALRLPYSALLPLLRILSLG